MRAMLKMKKIEIEAGKIRDADEDGGVAVEMWCREEDSPIVGEHELLHTVSSVSIGPSRAPSAESLRSSSAFSAAAAAASARRSSASASERTSVASSGAVTSARSRSAPFAYIVG